MEQVAGEPPQRKGGCIGAPENDRTGSDEIIDDGAVGVGDQVTLQAQPVGGRKAGLVHIDLYGDRNASQRTGVLSLGDLPVHCIGRFAHQIRPMGDDCIDLGIDLIESGESSLGGLARRNCARADEAGEFSRRQPPDFSHARAVPHK